MRTKCTTSTQHYRASQYDLELLQVRPLRDLSRVERRHRALLRTYHDNLPETGVQTLAKSMRMIGRFWKKLLKVSVHL